MKQVGGWIVLCLVLGIIVIYQLMNKPKELKTAFLKVGQIYSEFQLSKELDHKLQNVQTMRIAIIDSLELSIRKLEIELSKNSDLELQKQYQAKRKEYEVKQQQFSEDNAYLNQQYHEQINNQLNQYIEDYRKEKGYDYIFGATGSGSLMSAEPSYDITAEILSYVNSRYNGGQTK